MQLTTLHIISISFPIILFTSKLCYPTNYDTFGLIFFYFDVTSIKFDSTSISPWFPCVVPWHASPQIWCTCLIFKALKCLFSMAQPPSLFHHALFLSPHAGFNLHLNSKLLWDPNYLLRLIPSLFLFLACYPTDLFFHTLVFLVFTHSSIWRVLSNSTPLLHY